MTSRFLIRLGAALILITTFSRSAPRASSAAADPGQAGPCPVASQTVMVSTSITTTVHYPAGACGAWAAPPFPAIAFAHGFSLFGLSNGRSENAGNGAHLASWGFVVAIPSLPDAAETRVTNLRSVLDYLATQANTPGSFLSQQVDPERLAVAGYSLGGATALATAARDSRVKAVVALDPVYHEGGFGGEGAAVWNPQAEAPLISAPTGILGAPPSSCNADSDYGDIYPLTGATHKAWYRLSNASHCDFASPGNPFCSFTCGTPSSTRTTLSQRYMTAWFNYYLHHQLESYAYVYGAALTAEVTTGALTSAADTAPRAFSASSTPGLVQLNWAAYSHAVIAGYDLFRRRAGEPPPATPFAQVGGSGAYTDPQVTAGETLLYTVRSRDPAGNPHGLATEIAVTVAAGALPERLYLPLVVR